MEQYLKGRIKAFGHWCRECRFFADFHCTNPHWHGSRAREQIYGDKHYMHPDEEACVLYDGKEDYEEGDKG